MAQPQPSWKGNKGLIGGLHVQLLLLILIPTAMVLTAIALGGTLLHERAMRDLVGQRDARATQAAADNLAERLRQRENSLAFIAGSLDGTHSLEVIYSRANVGDLFDFGLLLTEDSGQVLDSWLPSGGWEWREAAGGTPAFVGHSDQRVLVVFSVLAEGGYLYGATSLEGLGIPQLLESLVTSSGSRAYLVDQDAHVLYDSQGTQFGQVLADHPGVRQALAGGSGFQRSGGQSHEDLVIGYSAVPRLGWALVVEEPWHSLTSPQLRGTYSTLLILLAMTLLGILVIAFSTLWIVRPLQQLKERAGRLVQGDFQALRESVGGIQEIGDLQRALLHMAQSVQQAQAQLHDYIGMITTAQEDERSRLARDLHDDTVQTLIALNQHAQMAQRTLERDPSAVAHRLTELRQLTEQAIQDIRAMIHDLRPTYLSELGLVSALEMLAEQEKDIPVSCHVQGEPLRLSSAEELAFYRIAQEALTNIRKHSRATQAAIELTFTENEVLLCIKDDGCGFSYPVAAGGSDEKHYGLIGMRERAQLIHSDLEITTAPGAGTTLRLRLPYRHDLLAG